MSSVEPIADRLAGVRAHVRQLYLRQGTASLLLWICAFLGATFAVDFCIPNLPRAVRLLFLCGGLGGLAYGYYRFLRYPLAARLSDDDLAAHLELQYPGLRDRLISTVQLLRRGADRQTSPEMVKALTVETVRAARELDFNAILLPERPRRLSVLAGIGVAALLVAAASCPQFAGIYLSRLCGSATPWPRKTQLSVQYSQIVARGDDVRIAVTAVRGFPSKAYIFSRFPSGAPEQHRMVRLPDKEEFRHEFAKVAESFSFSVAGGDDETGWFEVKVLAPPRLERVQAFFAYPRYMGMIDTPREKPEEGGNLRVPVGTRATLRIATDLPLASGRILLGRAGQPQEQITLGLEKDPSGELRILSGALDVVRDSEYLVEVTGANGLKNKEPVRYTIKALVDSPPTLRVVEPAADKSVTPTAVVPIRTTVTDDYGIRRVSLIHKLMGAEKPVEIVVPYDATHNSAEYGARKIDSTYEFDLAAVNAKEGDVICYAVQAEDTNELPQPNVTRSRQFVFTVVAKGTLENLLDERRMKVKEDLEKLVAYQQAERVGALRLQELLGLKPTLERAERQSVAGASTNQRQVSQRLERLTRELDDILRDVENNRLWDVTSRDKLAAMRDTLKLDAEAKSPEAANLLAQAANAPQPADRMVRFTESAARQNELLDDMRDVLAKMGDWEDYMEVVKIVRNLKDRQNRINKRIGEAEPK